MYLSFFDRLASISGGYFFAWRKTDTTPHSSWLDWTHLIPRYQRKRWHKTGSEPDLSGQWGSRCLWLCGWTGGVVISASLIKSQIPVLKQTLK